MINMGPACWQWRRFFNHEMKSQIETSQLKRTALEGAIAISGIAILFSFLMASNVPNIRIQSKQDCMQISHSDARVRDHRALFFFSSLYKYHHQSRDIIMRELFRIFDIVGKISRAITLPKLIKTKSSTEIIKESRGGNE